MILAFFCKSPRVYVRCFSKRIFAFPAARTSARILRFRILSKRLGFQYLATGLSIGMRELDVNDDYTAMVSFLGYTSAMKVLAIDPGYGRCGVAVLERRAGEKEILLYSVCIETPKNADFAARLGIVADECARLAKKYKPAAVAMEKLYFSTNQKTAMRVAEVRGALIQVATNLGIPVFEYTPGEIKSAAGGHGRAAKQQVAKMLRALVKIEKEIKFDDEYDAIAVGVTHLARHRV